MKGLENDDSKAAARALEDTDFLKAKSMAEYLMKKGEEHPKLEKLKEILDMDDDEKAIVFTEYRKSAENIKEELNEEGLDATKFIGQQGEEGMSQTEQIERLGEFGDGEYNVLVSTSIGEEGLDVPAVDYVIFYEPVASAVRDIQRAGRTGRQESGKVFVLIAENTRDEGSYWSAHHKKKRMNSILQELKDEVLEMEEGKNQKTLDGFDKEQEDDEEDSQLVIHADDRENSVAKELSRLDVKIEKGRLKVGDFLVSDRAAIERKKAADFVDSIVDNRLFDQVQELGQFDNPLIIIEGKDLFSHRDIHPNAIRGAMASVSLDYGIPVLWSQDEKGTAELLKALAKREQEEKDRTVAVRGTKSGKTQKDQQEFVVAGIPDINTKIAKRLLEHFGSIEEIFRASETELKDVKGVGDKTASKIRDLMTADYNE
jgi:Fanconi anemia group M protein